MNAAQQQAANRVVRSAIRLYRAGINEQAGYNDCLVTHWWNHLFGWGIGEPYCAMTVCMIASDAGVLSKGDFSAGAWALMDHLWSKGLGKNHPEVGDAVAYNWGHGHIETIIKVESSEYVWTVGGNTSSGQGTFEGDGVHLVRRYLPGQTYHHPFARLPGVEQGHARHPAPSWLTRDLLNRAPSPKQHGSDVRHVQSRLGFSGTHLDGVFGPYTADALQTWQRHHNITADGSVRDVTAILLG